LGAASALDAVAMAMAIASAVLANMGVSPAGLVGHTSSGVRALRARKVVP
jgi:hypothetical protein